MPISKRPLDATDENPPGPKKRKTQDVKRKLKFMEKIGYKSDRWHSLLMCIPPSSDEFKRLLVKEIGSLLNDKGGKLCFGCRNNGMIHGERITRREEDNLKLIIDDSLKKFHPFVSPSSYRVEFLPVSNCDLGERFVVEISICPGAQDMYEDEFREVYLRKDNRPFGPLSPHQIKDHVTAKYRKRMAALLQEASKTGKEPDRPSTLLAACGGPSTNRGSSSVSSKVEDDTSSAAGSGGQKKNSKPVSSNVGAKATRSSSLPMPSKRSGPISSSSGGKKSSHAASVSAENKPPPMLTSSSTASVHLPRSSQATTSAKVMSTSSATTSTSSSSGRVSPTTNSSKPVKLSRPRSKSVVQPLSHSFKANQLPPLIPRQQSIYGHPPPPPPPHNQAQLRACNEYPPCCNYQPLPSRPPPSENFPVFANLPRTPIPCQRPTPIPFQRPGPIPCQRPGLIPCQRPGLIPHHIPGLIPRQIPLPIPHQMPALVPYQRPSFPAQYP